MTADEYLRCDGEPVLLDPWTVRMNPEPVSIGKPHARRAKRLHTRRHPLRDDSVRYANVKAFPVASARTQECRLASPVSSNAD